MEPDRPDRPWEERHAVLLQRLGEESLYVPGAPGSGKSTFCRWLALLAAGGTLGKLIFWSLSSPRSGADFSKFQNSWKLGASRPGSQAGAREPGEPIDKI